MPVPILLWVVGALAALIGGAALLRNWNAVINWLYDFLPKVRAIWEATKEMVPHAARILVEKYLNGAEKLVRTIHQLAYKKDGQWVEKTTTRSCPEDTVPDWVRERVEQRGFFDTLLNRNPKKDITREIENQLQLEV